MKNKLLFVDDEPHILAALQDSLRKNRKQWDMTFACGGDEAIVELEINQYDVVVSDMRMPNVDGVDVLAYAKQRCPATVRIMLSGYAELDQTIRVSSLAHRYLTKPCDTTDLENTIKRALGIANKLDTQEFREIVGSVSLLPAGTSNQQMLMDLINSNNYSTADIANIVEIDIALTTKLLHLSNSAFFRQQREIRTAKDAVSYLGTDVVKSIVLAEQLFSLSEAQPEIDREWLNQLQQHCWLTAAIAKELMVDTEYADVAFTAGLLHEVGKLIPGVDHVQSSQDCAHDRTDQNDSFSYMGAYLLSLWGIPVEIVDAVAYHKNPSDIVHTEFDAVSALHIANRLAEWVRMGDQDIIHVPGLDERHLNELGQVDKHDSWQQLAQKCAAQINNSPITTSSRAA